MTRTERDRLVQLVVSGVADRLGRAVEEGELAVEGIDEQEAYQQVAKWLARLPGDAWDRRLPEPTR